ncbi:hypothetical protein WDW37_05780 [Bdellovibrionota bacterium FG-1]
MEVLNGESLIQQVVSLTELPEMMVHQEVTELLQFSGHSPETLTLEQLRVAMVAYLESIQASFEAEQASKNQDCLFDASGIKTSHFAK